MKQHIATKAFIVHQGKVLIIREAAAYSRGTNIGKYDFPGGKLDIGEHHDEGLKREVREECGLEVRVTRPFFVAEWRPKIPGEELQIIGIFFKCTTEDAKVALESSYDDAQWIDPAKHRQFDLIPVNHEVFEAYLVR